AGAASGRHVGYLRTAARLPVFLPVHRGDEPADGTALPGDPAGVRRGARRHLSPADKRNKTAHLILNTVPGGSFPPGTARFWGILFAGATQKRRFLAIL